jgi:hypothetical protein
MLIVREVIRFSGNPLRMGGTGETIFFPSRSHATICHPVVRYHQVGRQIHEHKILHNTMKHCLSIWSLSHHKTQQNATPFLYYMQLDATSTYSNNSL